MHQSCTAGFRRSAAVGAAVAIVAASSAFGIGATAAVADDGPTASTPTTTITTGSSTSTSSEQPGGAASVDTAAPADETVITPPAAPADGSAAAPAPDPSDTPAATPTPPASDTGTGAPTAPAATEAPSTRTTNTDTTTPDAQAAAAPALAFPEGTSAAAPLALTATAGDTVSRTFTATGGSEPVRYWVLGKTGTTVGDGSFAHDFSLDQATGVLSGTARIAQTYSFRIVATSGSERATEYVQLTVKPGAPVGVTYSVSSSDNVGMWQVEADGVVWEQAIGQGRVRIVPDVPAVTGSSLTLAGLAIDAFSNRTTPGGDDDPYPRSIATSTVASDRIVWSDTGSNTVTFTEPGTRTITVAEGGVSTSFTAVVTAQQLAFEDGSSADHPIAVGATAGEPFTRPFPVSGAAEEVRYELRSAGGQPFDDSSAPDGPEVSVDPTTGVLTGTATTAGSFPFEVVATSGGQEAVAHVELTVSPAAFAGFTVGVMATDRTGSESWGVDGDTVTHFVDGAEPERVDAIPVRQGDRMLVLAVPIDAYGNAVADHDDLTITSDVATDRIAYDPDTAATWVTFEHASPHIVTVAYQDRTQAIPFAVQPVAAPAGSTTNTSSGRLAYTGADTSGPLAWALGLLAAGGGLLVHRLRRRRA
ncbi:hypothetical protein [Curtobacterium pusillum]|uniref:hypothetical protein n=1 Tax=Curtobacterium pusillum TaxID=69373 RepID=UPI0011A21A50|nr:hypothetical protein [Curtobacterium pusillum]